MITNTPNINNGLSIQEAREALAKDPEQLDRKLSLSDGREYSIQDGKVTRTNHHSGFEKLRESWNKWQSGRLGQSDAVAFTKLLPVDVAMGRSITVSGDNTLTTSGLSDCSAIAVLTGWDGAQFADRTLMHLTGGNVYSTLNNEDNAVSVLDNAKRSLKGGGKVIICGGNNSSSNMGLGMIIGQKNILALVNSENTQLVIVGSKNISVFADGSFKLDSKDRGLISDTDKNIILDYANN